jgi:hypothetical protein
MLGFAKRERFVARCVKVDFLSQIRKYLLCYVYLARSFRTTDCTRHKIRRYYGYGTL